MDSEERRKRERSAPNRAILLLAGRGNRLRPFTDTTPKPLLPHNGRPTLHTILLALTAVGVQHLCLITHHLAEQIEAYVGNGRHWGFTSVTTYRQPVPAGTAHALQQAQPFLTEPCWLLAGDYILPPDYLFPLRHTYQTTAAPLALSLKPVPPAELSQRSSVRFDSNGRLLEIIEKPAPGQAASPLAASLLMIIPPQIRPYLQTLTLSPRQEYELPTILNTMLADGCEAAYCIQPAPAEWQVGNE